jgi:ribosomal protein S12 methylthiotransferase
MSEDEIIQAKIPFKHIRPVNMFKVHEKCLHTDTGPDYFHIKIAEGCLRECTFCVINKAKGYIASVPYEKIAGQVEIALARQRPKIKLTAEDTFAYGIDKGTSIIELVKRLITEYPGIYLHIRWLKKYAHDILSFCKKGVFKELHIGLQHVGETVLRSMGRPVVFTEIYDIIREIKREIPGFYLVADILVGFPGETEENFNEVCEFFKQHRCFNKVKHFGYSDVKGAPSTGFADKVPADVIAARWDRLDKILGERAYSLQNAEERIDNETFRVTRFEDYSFCRDTFEDELDEKIADQDLTFAKSQVLKEDKGDFGF